MEYPYDTTPFVKLSIEEVVKTLFEGIVLVFLVMYLFLQNLRATLIPTIAVPVVLLGTFAIMAAVGFSINTLSMFGLVLAIGLLVDDAIVVVENVERVMAEEGLSPRRGDAQGDGPDHRRAGRRGARAVGGVRAGGVLGRLGRRDLPAVLADDRGGDGAVGVRRADSHAGAVRDDPEAADTDHDAEDGLLRLVQPHLRARPRQYLRRRAARDRALGRWLIIYLVVIAAVGLLFVRLPKSFLPDEDQGTMFVLVQTPPGSTQERTGKRAGRRQRTTC